MVLKLTIRADASSTVQLARRVAAANRAPLLTAMGVYMEASVNQNFAAEGQRDPDPALHPDLEPGVWARNSAFTLALKGPRPVLLDSGILRASINHFSNGKDAVSVGTNVRYGRTHQEGATIAESRVIPIKAHAQRAVGRMLGVKRAKFVTIKAGTAIPRRPFVLFQRGDVAALAEIAARWVERSVRA